MTAYKIDRICDVRRFKLTGLMLPAIARLRLHAAAKYAQDVDVSGCKPWTDRVGQVAIAMVDFVASIVL